MLEVTVIKTGTNSQGNWALVTATQAGFKLTGFVKPEAELAEGEVVQLPKLVADAIKWQS